MRYAPRKMRKLLFYQYSPIIMKILVFRPKYCAKHESGQKNTNFYIFPLKITIFKANALTPYWFRPPLRPPVYTHLQPLGVPLRKYKYWQLILLSRETLRAHVRCVKRNLRHMLSQHDHTVFDFNDFFNPRHPR